MTIKGSSTRNGLLRAVAFACALALALCSPLVLQGAAVRAAAGSTLWLDPASVTIGVGQTFQTSILLNTGGVAIDAIQADLTFPPATLEVTALDYTSGSILAVTLEHGYDNAAGTVTIIGGIFPPGFTGTAGKVATVTFRAKASGIATVAFAGTSAVLRNGVNTLAGTTPGQFTIASIATPGVVVSPTLLACTEGSHAGYTLTLAARPSADVVVNIVPDAQLTAAPPSAVFTPDRWNLPQLVTVTAIEDSLVQGARTVLVRHVVTSADPAWQGLPAPSVTVTIADNDVAPTGHGITATAGAGGTIAPSGLVAVPDRGAQRFTIIPDEGNEVASLTVDGQSTFLFDRSGMTYQFTDVTADHTIACTFRPTADTTPPVLTSAAQSGVVLTVRPWLLAFHVTDDRGPCTVTVSEGTTVHATRLLEGAGEFSLDLADGRHALVLSAADAASNRTQKELEIIVDTTGPAVSWAPAIPSSVTSASLTLRGTVRDALSGVRSLAVGGRVLVPSADGSFSLALTLAEGANVLKVEAVDTLGNTSSTSLNIQYVRTMTIVLVIDQNSMLVDGRTVAVDASGQVAPVIQNSRTLLPVRVLIETLGGTIAWDPVARKVTVGLAGHEVVLWIGKSTALVDGLAVPVDAADKRVVPIITVGRTLLPLRFLSESLGLGVQWDPIARSITLTYAP
jgi:hypothetical protein